MDYERGSSVPKPCVLSISVGFTSLQDLEVRVDPDLLLAIITLGLQFVWPAAYTKGCIAAHVCL